MKNFKKVIASAIVAIMMLAVIPFSVSAAASDWDGNTATSFGGGSGTEADPYIIDSANQLSFLAKSTYLLSLSHNDLSPTYFFSLVPSF